MIVVTGMTETQPSVVEAHMTVADGSMVRTRLIAPTSERRLDRPPTADVPVITPPAAAKARVRSDERLGITGSARAGRGRMSR